MKAGLNDIPEARALLDAEPASHVLVVMPLTRLRLNDSFSIGSYYFFPEEVFDIEALSPRKNRSLEDVHQSGTTRLEGQASREIVSSFTGFDRSVLESSPLVVFSVKMDWNTFKENNNHQDDIEIISRFSSEVEKALDVIRFRFCRLDLLDTLPGVPGSWYGSEDYLGMMVYSPIACESYLCAGSAVECSAIIKGLGLELDSVFHLSLLNPETGHVSAIASHGLSLLSDAMSSPNETIKYIRIMILLEFLACPNEYQQWKKIKGVVACYSANTKRDYHELRERFMSLTSKKENGIEVGLRTLIVHQGKNIQALIESKEARKNLFSELQSYVSCMISHMIEHEEMKWDDYYELRESMKLRFTN